MGEELQCGCAGNIHAVAMMNKLGAGIVCHVKREISASCDVFVLGGSGITRVITGNSKLGASCNKGLIGPTNLTIAINYTCNTTTT